MGIKELLIMVLLHPSINRKMNEFDEKKKLADRQYLKTLAMHRDTTDKASTVNIELEKVADAQLFLSKPLVNFWRR